MNIEWQGVFPAVTTKLKPDFSLDPVSYTHLDVYKRQVLEATQQFLSDLGLRAAARCDLLKDCLLYTSRCV